MQRNKTRATFDPESIRNVESSIREALKSSGYRSLRRLECEFDGVVFSLRGCVSTFYEKQVAQQIVLSRLDARVCFDNQLDVIAGGQRQKPSVKTIEPVSRRLTQPMALIT